MPAEAAGSLADAMTALAGAVEAMQHAVWQLEAAVRAAREVGPGPAIVDAARADVGVLEAQQEAPRVAAGLTPTDAIHLSRLKAAVAATPTP